MMMTLALAGMKHVDGDQGKSSEFSVRDAAAQVLRHPAHPRKGTQKVVCGGQITPHASLSPVGVQ